MEKLRVLCIGAGPAGLTAGLMLSKNSQIDVTVVESHPTYVGGLAKTVEYRGYRFDIGGHRFFTKSDQVKKIWEELLPHDLIRRPRSSRIFFQGKVFPYPLKFWPTIESLGIFESILFMVSYLRAKVTASSRPTSFEQWVVQRFGRKLFELFFESYTEKVWGRKCREISSEWAAQRIQNLPVGNLIKTFILPNRYKKKF